MESLTSAQDALLREACSVWASLCPTSAQLPPSKSVDPLSFRPLVGRMSVVEVLHTDEGLRFKYRLQGTAVTLGNGPRTGDWTEDWTGRHLDTVPLREFASEAAANFSAAVGSRRPVSRFISGLRDGLALSYEVLVLPFGNSSAPDRLLVANIPLPSSASDDAGDNPTSLDFYHARLFAGTPRHQRNSLKA